MPNLDSTAKAAVNSHFAAEWIIFLDIQGDPLRITTGGANVTFSSTGDSDLDGNTFVAFGGKLIDVGDVSNSDSGSGPTEIKLSGIVSMDTALVNEIGDKTKWQGRLVRIWFQLYDAAGVTKQGAIVSYKTGYMSKVSIAAAPDGQTITLVIENYLSFTTQPSNRSYLNQKDYDSADTSAAATIASANGLRSGSGGGGALGGGSAGGGIGDQTRLNYNQFVGSPP